MGSVSAGPRGEGWGRDQGFVWCGGWPSERVGGLETGARDRGWFGARIRKPSPMGSVSGWTWRGGVGEGPGGLCGAGEGQVSGLGGLETGARDRGAVWRAKPKTEPIGLGFGWTWRGGVGEGPGGLSGVVDGQVSGWGGAGNWCT